MPKPLVAIVGRPNVGKSMLFNKLTGRRAAIVEDTPGVTRDRIYGDCDWNGREFELVDTGGIEPNTDSEMLQFMRRQAELAIAAADVIVMVTDVKTGVTAADQDVANMLLRSRKPVCLAVNKCDSVGPTNPDVYEFYALGLGDPIEVSAVHGHGTGDLLDWCVAHFPAPSEQEDEGEVINVAIIGKPNVGKSSLLNRILGQERVIVSNVAGTTRDAIDSYFENEFGKYRFIDTAGMRRKSKVDDAIEKYSNLRSIAAIERADVCLILIDAVEGVTEQDTKIAGLAHEAGKASIIVVNKWDLVDKDTNTMAEKTAEIRRDLSYLTYAPIIFLSALTGQRVGKLYERINAVANQSAMRITTGMLNNILEDATARVQPPTDKGRRLKIYYMTQVGETHVRAVADCCRAYHIPIRIGVNGGSLEKTLLEKYGHPTPEALVESAFSHIRMLEDVGFGDICVSMKSSNVPLMMQAYRLMHERSDYPLHVGVTETGTEYMGTIKSAMGIGGLLCLGIGDTIRVSLTADPVREVVAAKAILKAAGLRKQGVNLISCPTCGRTKIDLIGLANRVQEALQDCDKELTVAVMGCVVNGPGEAREADIGIAGGDGCGVLFVHGELKEKLPYDELLPALLRYIDAM